jgi:Mrp family chromosome partitioning ATPase
VKAKAKVLDILHLTGRTASTEDSRTILSEKEFKGLLRQLKEGEKDPKILSARQKLENLKTLWEN